MQISHFKHNFDQLTWMTNLRCQYELVCMDFNVGLAEKN